MAVNGYGPYGSYGHTAHTAIRVLVVAQRLVQIGDQVLDVLDPDGKPHQAVGEAHLALEIGRHAGVRHRRRVADETLDAAQRLGEREDLRVLHEVPRPAHVAQFYAQHPAEPRHLPAGEVVLRVRRQARIV